MSPYILLMIGCLVWTVIFALVFSWTYDTDSGWDEVKALKLPFMAKLRLMIPFSQKWITDIPDDMLIPVSRWRYRALVMEWAVMIPMLIGTQLFFSWELTNTRTELDRTMPSNKANQHGPQ